MRVLYLHHCPNRGGSSTSLRNLIRSFPIGSVEPLICCPRGSAKILFESSQIPVIEIESMPTFDNPRAMPLKGLNLLRLFRAFKSEYKRTLLNTMESFKPDIVHFNECILLKPMQLAKSKGYRTVIHARITLSENPRWAWKYQTRKLGEFADRIIAIDQSVLRTLGEQTKATVVYNPVNNIQYSHSTNPEVNLNDVRPYSDDNPLRVGFVSLFYAFKGVFEILEVAKKLKNRKDICFIFAGSNGRPASFYSSPIGRLCHFCRLAPDIEKQMKRLIKKWSLGNVQILGFVEDVPQLMKTLDVLVFPSKLDAVPRSVFEAGYWGVPSIVSMEHKTEDIINDGRNGLIIPEGDTDALLEAILQFKKNPSLKKRLGSAAQKDFADKFNSKKSAERVLEIYRELIAEKSLDRKADLSKIVFCRN